MNASGRRRFSATYQEESADSCQAISGAVGHRKFPINVLLIANNLKRDVCRRCVGYIRDGDLFNWDFNFLLITTINICVMN
jgi:hypothetical protein